MQLESGGVEWLLGLRLPYVSAVKSAALYVAGQQRLQLRCLAASSALRYGAIPSRILADFDSHLKMKVIMRFGLDEATDDRWLHLPLRWGCLGIASLEELQAAALVGATSGFLGSS